MRLILATRVKLAALLGVVVFLTGCAVAPQAPSDGGPQPSADPAISAELEPYYQQELNWKACGGERTYCGTLEVPADWANPEGERFKLAIAYREADSAKPIGSVLFNPGGPGASGVNWLKESSDQIGTSDLRKNFNIVGFDPRGVGASEPRVKCLSAQEKDVLYYGASAFKIGSDQEVADTRAKLAKFVESCFANTGNDLKFIDTISAARDMDVIRAVFGDSKINYLGFSYGTYLGTVYANLFPQRVGRMVLDGAIDPTVDDETQDLFQLKGFDQALRDFLSDCLENQDCPFSGSLALAEAKVANLLRSIEEKPLNTDSGRELTVWGALTGIIMPLYSQDWWPSLSQGFAEALKGDGTTLLALADVYNDRSDDGTYLSNTIESNIAISCMDSRASSDEEAMRSNNRRLLSASKMLGRYWQFGALTCEQWPFPAVSKPNSFSAKGTDRILVIGTTGDPATPYWQAVSLANQVLSNAQLVTFNGEGHTAYGQQSVCINRTVDDFFIKNMVPTEDPDCG